ncbi:pancreatic triacylglycerol lipase-like isoform X2 [Rhodnius prolixus]|uniref:pancreatic triacylglycerol lipase-like isoform X2 n=1 Tax=Rhodnius prolixus TaxID=13249 RepID=UPI003D18E2A7
MRCSVNKIGIQEEALANMGRMMSAILRNRLTLRNPRNKKEICYDLVGCFPPDRPFLKLTPQNPEDLGTRFYLYTRNASEEVIEYGDERTSLVASDFRTDRMTRILVHGFKGSSKDRSAQYIVSNLLKLEDCNVILLDWSKGAQGQTYRVSAANTELVGRQLALLLLDLISLGANPSAIHLIGFSLGAHIAGFAGRSLLSRGIRLSRITGLDPASPLFREHLVAASIPALNDQDAALVDVVHTAGSILWTEGFGLLRNLGHVDFFPNGGQDQPGCTHVFASLIVSHLEGTVNSSAVCNHLRGFQLFLESIPSPKQDGCQFRAFPCASREHFRSGACFPMKCDINSTDGSCGIMGFSADKGIARGPLYLVTRDSPPFCGDQLQASAVIIRPSGVQLGQRARGFILALFKHGRERTHFRMAESIHENFYARQLAFRAREPLGNGVAFRGLAAARFGSTPADMASTEVTLEYRSLTAKISDGLELDYFRVSTMDGHSWTFCGKIPFKQENSAAPDISTATVQLKLGLC